MWLCRMSHSLGQLASPSWLFPKAIWLLAAWSFNWPKPQWRHSTDCLCWVPLLSSSVAVGSHRPLLLYLLSVYLPPAGCIILGFNYLLFPIYMEIHASARRDACWSEWIGLESVEMIIWQENHNHPHCNLVYLHGLNWLCTAFHSSYSSFGS